eukprot:TRINITY_DN472_c0_g1_i1.p1 TRINITY_DN472_c0_g1~~TRINITY_DN472_c0_g1_i1.p1  ORF type:complete len:263 (-),score=84.23 TRINITY_DN472_c0_g1_i1:255-1043(-)
MPSKRKSAPRSKASRAGIVFPVSRFAKLLRDDWSRGTGGVRIAQGAPIYLAAVLEYLTAEIVELAGNFATNELKKKRIIPRAIAAASFQDEELHQLLKGTVFPNGGTFSLLALAASKAAAAGTPSKSGKVTKSPKSPKSPSKPTLKKTSSQSGIAKPTAKAAKLAASSSSGSTPTGTEDSPLWQYQEGSKWKNYQTAAVPVVETAYQDWLKNPYIDVRSVKSGDWSYQVDFNRQTQTNVDHANHTVRSIRRVPPMVLKESLT